MKTSTPPTQKHLNHNTRAVKTNSGPHRAKIVCTDCDDAFVSWCDIRQVKSDRTRMPSGKYSGVLKSEVPEEYLHWVVENTAITSRLNQVCKTELKRRGIEVSKPDLITEINNRLQATIYNVCELIKEKDKMPHKHNWASHNFPHKRISELDHAIDAHIHKCNYLLSELTKVTGYKYPELTRADWT